MREWQLAVLAIVLLGFAAVSRRIDGTSLTPPMLFTAAGLLVGVDALDLLAPGATGEAVKILAEATLAVVLFSDASRIDLRVLREEIGMPARLLGIGLPLTIVAGFVLALLLPDLAWPEALVLAIVLAPTDAALGQAVVTYRRLPPSVRQSLNVESGLNDGICVPLFLIAVSVAQAEEGAIGNGHAARIVLEEIGYGALMGAVAGLVAAAVLLVAGRRRWVGAGWAEIVPVAGAALAYGLADPIGGSGFIAAFVGGMVFGGIRRAERHDDERELLEEAGDLLSAITFVVFGAVLLGPAIGDLSWSILAYALVSLTIVRMAPVALAMLGTHARIPTVAFLGWFGPRGLASIVFALLIVEQGGLPHDNTILTTAFVTVGLSILLHGLTAAPLSRRYADWVDARAVPESAPVETLVATDVPWRRLTPDRASIHR